ncbi:MAG: MFS transporter [Nitrososphaeraceae archaeon]
MVNSDDSKNIKNFDISYKWTALGNTTIGTLLAALDTNMIFIALPVIAAELQTSLTTMIWIVIGYSLVTASILLNFGRLSDIFGRVKLYTLGFVIFTIGSLLCSLSQTGEQLVLFRLVQAIGAAFIFSNSVAILTDSFPITERGKALGINQIAIMFGSVLGLFLGGFLTSYLGWRSIFWINVPIGIVGIFLSYKKLIETGTFKREKIDWFGNISFAAGLFLILIAITFGSFGIISNVYTISVLFIGGISLFFIFPVIEKYLSFDYPMFDFSLFKIKTFLGGNIAILLNSIARGDFILLISLYLQSSFLNLDPLQVGIYLLPVSITLAIFGPLSGWLSDKYGSRFFSSLGLFISGLGFLFLTQLQIDSSFFDLLLPFILLGTGMGIFSSPNRSSIMNNVPHNRRGISASTGTTLFYIGRSLSVGLSFLIMVSFLSTDQVREIIFDFKNNNSSKNIHEFDEDRIISQYNGSYTETKFLDSIRTVFFISAIIVFVSVVPASIKNNNTSKIKS